MSRREVAPYGSWQSPLTSELVASGTVWPERVILDDEDILWNELRPKEKGRNVIVRRTSDGQISDITPTHMSARTRVHEYGGGAFTAIDRTVYFCNFTDQRIYRQEPGALPHPITPESDFRYADIIIDRRRRRIICVREDHRVNGRQPVNALVSVRLDGDPTDAGILVSGNDFYSSPRLSPDGSCLAWVTWNHPNMPWDGTELWVGELGVDGSIKNAERVAGAVDESVLQPEWSPDGILHFISDRADWWNLYRLVQGQIEPLCKMEADFARPQWVFGMSNYAFESVDRIICAYTQRGIWHLGSINAATGRIEFIKTPFTDVWSLRASPGQAVFLAGSPTEPPSVVRLDLATDQIEQVRRSEVKVDTEYLSIPKAIEFPTETGLKAYAFFYPPRNRDFTGPSEKRPPLLVISHGGPTAAAPTYLRLGVSYWTSRGFAVLDVNYGGSSGYGRAYRQRLNGQWGVVDLNDCVNGARYLVKIGEVDGDRLAIRGGSAGGYTTLCALTFRSTFRAGASYFGVSDLEALAKDTHKFESHYLDRLIGAYPERRGIYRERSPIHFVDQISCPMIFFQGLEDKVVPPDQAELMVKALRERGLPVAYVPFEGEQHGFRRAENIKRSLEVELYFYSKIFGFELTERVEPVQIDNL
jgi:dipeptidyl aminopeptidase/acylaminoacyl peptidase